MVKDDSVFVRHIIDSIKAIESYTKNLDVQAFSYSQQIIDAVIRRFEIIGEATKNISKELKAKNKMVPWQDMADMRNYLIHEYFGVDEVKVWETIKNDLPRLKIDLKKILKAYV